MGISQIINCILSLILVIGVAACGEDEAYSGTTGGYVHFSIDDATQIFQDITINQSDSIFEQPVLKELQKNHESYDIKCTLYIYENLDDYNISQMPDIYRDEFVENAEWLKLGFHGYDEYNPAETGITQQEFEASYDRVCEEIRRFAGEESVTQTLRLHYWYGTEDMLDFLDSKGVRAVLCPDSSTIGYDLTEDENNMLKQSESGVFEDNIIYYKTDMRYENIEKVKDAFEQYKEDQIIVVFTHAWCFEENASKIEDSMEWLTENGYKFTFLENREGL